MKRTIIFSMIAGAFALSATSCVEIDNFDAPESRLYGTVYDSELKTPIIQDQNHTRIRMWEVSFENAKEQEIPIKKDGTYNNHRLFPGYYDMVPIGAWWPVDTVRQVRLASSTAQDFEVLPYVRVIDVQWELDGVDLYVTCRLKAPQEAGMPDIQDVRVFLSMNQFCGADHNIGTYNTNDYRMKGRTAWSAFEKADDGGTTTITMPRISTSDPTLRPLRLKAGYTYFMRVGASATNVNMENKYNYSETVLISVPQ